MFLYPKPKSVEVLEGSYLQLKQGDIVISDEGLPQGSIVKLDLSCTELPEQAYKLEVLSDEIKIFASSIKGAKIAFQTLRQVIANGAQEGVPCVKISDEPRIKIRGFMLDISRCKVPTMQTLAYLVDMLALFKYNRLELYTEHTFAFKNHELVWGDASPMTPQQYKMLDALCKRAGIELVPNMNSLGHMDRWLRYPEYQSLAESKAPFIDTLGTLRPYPTTLYPDKKSLDFIASLYDDFLPNFTSDNFNVGCDEPWELGMGRSKQECEKVGKYRVYIEYLKKLAELCKARGKRMHFWADVLLEEPELAKELPDDVVAVLWGYYPDSPLEEEAKILHDLGRKFIIAGGTNTWNSFAIRLNAAYKNTKIVCDCAVKYGAEGVILTNWGDNGNHQAWCAMWLDVVAFAQAAWSGDFEENDVCIACDKFVFQDTQGYMSKAISSLGKCDPSEKLNSLHNKLFFASADGVKSLMQEGAAVYFDAMFKGANEALEHLSKAKPHCPDAEICIGEIALAADLIKWSVVRAHNDTEVKSLDLRKGLKLMKNQYEQLWLARARVGGLFESSSKAFENRTHNSL